MRAERLDSSVTIDTPRYLCSSIGDEGYDGYRDTEALGVVGAFDRTDRVRLAAAIARHYENEEWARAEMAARARSGRLHPPGLGLDVILGRV